MASLVFTMVEEGAQIDIVQTELFQFLPVIVLEVQQLYQIGACLIVNSPVNGGHGGSRTLTVLFLQIKDLQLLAKIETKSTVSQLHVSFNLLNIYLTLLVIRLLQLQDNLLGILVVVQIEHKIRNPFAVVKAILLFKIAVIARPSKSLQESLHYFFFEGYFLNTFVLADIFAKRIPNLFHLCSI